MLSASEETYEQILCGGLEELEHARKFAIDTIYSENVRQEELPNSDAHSEDPAVEVS
jgi:hypothetical protein